MSLRKAAAGHFYNRLTMLAVTVVALLMLAGCSGGSLNNFFSGSGGADAAGMPPVAFADIIGPPKSVGDQLTTQLVSAARQKSIPVVTEQGQASAFTVQGYLAQSNERNAEKFSYILDVTDKSGKRVHRILGEETVSAKPDAKPWSSINQAAMQKIATKSANDLATWLPTQSASTSAVASASRPAEDAPPASSQRRTASTSASSRSDSLTAVVPPVSGAPGDGRSSLTNAMRSRLKQQGVRITSSGGDGIYKVSGKVSVGQASGGNESVKIVWQLTSPTGRDLGTVTQQSTVTKGSLDRSWGQAAVSAGNAAAAEIMKLIKKNRG